MTLEELGYNERIKKLRTENNLEEFEIGRVVAEHKERYTVRTVMGEFDAEITGSMRFLAKSREQFPAVGDWVALTVCDSGFAIILAIIPRISVIKRKAIAQFGEIQIIAANIDYAFLVQAVDRDFNINRLERYLIICHSSNVTPVVVLTKIDLIDESRISEILTNIKARIPKVLVVLISNETKKGYETLKTYIEKGKTYCLLGSSGVGKSTLLNNLSGNLMMKTNTISQSTNKGRHVTSHRELFVLENGGILIDNPGMREVGIADTSSGLEMTFDKIFSFSRDCKFKDCTHTKEVGCRVLEAIDKREISFASYENYMRMEKEKAHFESTMIERRKKDKKLGKTIKNYKKFINHNQ